MVKIKHKRDMAKTPTSRNFNKALQNIHLLITCQISSPENPHAIYNSLGFVGLSTLPDTVTNSALSFIRQSNSFTTNLPSPFPLCFGET